MIKRDVAKRVCSGASVRPSSARLPLGIGGCAADFGVRVGLGLTQLCLGDHGLWLWWVKGHDNKVPVWSQGSSRGRS